MWPMVRLPPLWGTTWRTPCTNTAKLMQGKVFWQVGRVNFVGNAVDQGVSDALLNIIQNLGVDKPFLRHQEADSDRTGVYLMAEMGCHTKEVVSIWQK